jgi:hypothetical protein
MLGCGDYSFTAKVRDVKHDEIAKPAAPSRAAIDRGIGE